MYSAIHVLGERVSGTNYLLQLLKENTNIPVYDTLLVHKHFTFDKKIIESHNNVLFLVITKELHSFLKSFYNAPHHVVGTLLNEKGVSTYKGTNVTMNDFLTNEVCSDIAFINNRPDVKYKYVNTIERHDNPVELYYDKLLFFLTLRVNKYQNVDYIKYEELNANPDILIPLLKRYNIYTKTNTITDMTFYKSERSTEYKPSSYEEFDEMQKSLINELEKKALDKLCLRNNVNDITFEYNNDKYYTSYVVNEVNSMELQTIPKKIHFIWIGKRIPEKYLKNIYNCKNVNSEWDVHLWTDNSSYDIVSSNSENIIVKHVNEIQTISGAENMFNNYGFKADIFRLEIVYKYGGIYSDIDSSWITPLSSIFEKEFVNYRCDFRLSNISNSLFGLISGSPMLHTILFNLKTHIQYHFDTFGKIKQHIPIISGPSMFSYFIEKYFKGKYKLNYIHQSFCMLGGLHQSYASCYRHYGNYPRLIYTYQTFDGNW